MLDDLAQQYDFVIVCAPSQSEMLLTRRFAAVVDANLLVVVGERSREPAVAWLRDVVLEAGGNLSRFRVHVAQALPSAVAIPMVLRLGPIVAVAAVALLGACKYGTRPDDVLSTTQQIDLVESAPLAFAPWTNRAIPYCVGPGDKLRIKFTVTREMDEDVVVSPDGFIGARATGQINVEGRTLPEIMRRSGKSKPVVWRWQAQFMAEGVDGLTRDRRKPGKQPLPATVVQRVVDLTLGPPPGDATHWTGRMLAKAAGVSLRSVQRILEAHRLAPHHVRTFKLSTDPKFAAKLKDIVGLYVDPPAHAVVLSVNRGKSRRSTAPSRGCR